MFEERIANIGITLDIFRVCRFNYNSLHKYYSLFFGLYCLDFYGIGATNRTRQEIQCLPYAGFLPFGKTKQDSAQIIVIVGAGGQARLFKRMKKKKICFWLF